MNDPKIVPTDEQEEIIRATSSGSESLMLSAYAGCAKTSTLGMLGGKIRGPALALAFNKSIQVELGKRFGPNFEVKTMNGFGFGALMRGRPRVVKWSVETKKLGKIITQVAKDRKVDLDGDSWDGIRRLVSAAQNAGLVPASQGEGLVPDDRESWQGLAEDLWMDGDTFEFVWELARLVLVENNRQTELGVISFDDQVYFPTVFDCRLPLFPVMLVDEAQDLSPLQHAMLAKAMRPDGRLVVCGDSRQAIYGFRGADSASMQKMKGLREKWRELPLTLTFRCPRAVVSRQQGHAPGFRAFRTNPEGEVKRWRASPDDPMAFEGWTWADVIQASPKPGATLAILCRNNGPLFSMAFKLLRSGIGVVMLGRDLGKGLVALSRKICPDDGEPIGKFVGLVKDWKESERSLAIANGHEERIAGIDDRGECLLAVADSAGCANAGQVRGQLERLFAREDGLVVLGSIHRSKGLEWDLVIHLDPWRVPSKQAKRAAERGDGRQLEQEWNLKYVCETRTRHTLVEADLEDFNLGGM